MEKQVLVIQFVGEQPTPEQAAAAIVALQKAGTYIDTTVQPTMCHLSEKEQAEAMMVYASKKASKGSGIIVKVQNPEPIISATKAEKLARVLKEFLENE
jgi:hypothetical protein